MIAVGVEEPKPSTSPELPAAGEQAFQPLAPRGLAVARGEEAVAVTHDSPPEAKIALFRSLFRGRDDVYARRFESRRSDQVGYSPACDNEWLRGVCAKPKVRCGECANQRFMPLSEEVLRRHLAGLDDEGQEFVAAAYPMLRDETCFFLAVKFAKADWRDDAAALRETCRQLGLPVAIERTRLGNAAHVWLFFAQAVPAALARKLAAHLLTETMARRPEIGLDSYDHFSPNQDTLPKGSFGSLIPLPLQKQARRRGNSVFVDEAFLPWPDQWHFLSQQQTIDRAVAERIVRAAERRGQVVGVRQPLLEEDESCAPPGGWAVGGEAAARRRPTGRKSALSVAETLPSCLELVLDDQIRIARQGLPAALRDQLLRLAAFQNPLFYRAQAMRVPTSGTPRIIACADEQPQHLALPRGCLDEVRTVLADLGIGCRLRDERVHGEPLGLRFRGSLRSAQQAALEALAAHDIGVLAATTAFGKTVVAAALIARRDVSTLILVHRQQLLEQWIERLSSFLDLPAGGVGRIGGGRRKANGRLDVALIQSLVRQGVVDECVAGYAHLVVDECHHLPAASFAQVARRARARYVLGLSATVVRQDGQHPVLFMHCGPVRHRVDARRQAAERPFTHGVFVRPTSFRLPAAREAEDAVVAPDKGLREQRIGFHALYEALIADPQRNRLIVDDIVAAVREGRSPVVLTERTQHLEWLAERLEPHVRHLVVLRGGMGRKPLREALARLGTIPEREERIVLATGGFLGEGFDDARLDTLFLTLPISWRGTIAQYVGRLHRLHGNKREVRVYDYADLNVALLARMFERRCGGYEAVGYRVFLPASAVPGWPPEVPLPIEADWKRDYAASVRRLVRDGVDVPLGELFVAAARAGVEPEFRLPPRLAASVAGVERARSASEAFLYRRLATLPETAGRFRLNGELPIPFDGNGSMEVDLLADRERLAVEIDGPQHLGDPSAYRRDRRKDALLQENGYLVLRFLAEDVGKNLANVLDTLLRAVLNRTRQLAGVRREPS